MASRSFTRWNLLAFPFVAGLVLVMLCLASLAHPAQAASPAQLEPLAAIVVTTNNPAVAADNQCSLIEAIENANADAAIHTDCPAGTGPDTISLPNDAVLLFSTVYNTTDGNNALPPIAGTMTILGNGAALVRANGAVPDFRFFHVAQGADLTLVNINLRQGSVDPTGTNQLILGGGAILNRGTLFIVDSNISFNRAGYGGAIYHGAVTGTLTLNNTTFTSNQATFFGGALYTAGQTSVQGGLLRHNQAAVGGGAILHSSAPLTLTNTTLSDNTTQGTGAGLAAYAALTDSHVYIQGTTVISNVAGANGGGLVNSAAEGYTAQMTVVGSSILSNRALSTSTATGYGGGMVNGWLLPLNGGTANLTVRQSTLADNVAQAGGGIANIDFQGYPTRTVTLTLVQSTLARNGAEGSGVGQGSGGGLLNHNGAATVGNSTFSANYALGADPVTGGRGGAIGSSSSGVATTVQVVNATLALNRAAQAGGGIALVALVTDTTPTLSLGNTLIQANVLTGSAGVTTTVVIPGTEGCSPDGGTITSLGHNIEGVNSCGLSASGDLTNTLVLLAPLADNGGPTPTHLIGPLTVGFNLGDNALCAAAPVDNVDQRGVARPQGATCDVGAVEVAPGVLTYLMPILFGQESEVLPESIR